MKKLSCFLLVALILALLPLFALAEFKPGSGEINGYMINEYYFVLDHHSGSIDDGGIQGRHGFWFRRIYFTYNNALTDAIKMRLRFEMNSPGDFTTIDTLDAFVKDAYLSAKISGQELIAGIISPPTYNVIEDIWGYRSLEKTPLDLMKLRSSRDFGIALKGNFDSGKTASYMVMFGNGSSNKGETDNGKIIYGQLNFFPTKGLTLQAYADYETKPDDKSYYVLQGFGGYESDWGRIGLQYAVMNSSHNSEDYTYNVFSSFAVIKAAKNVEIITRYDKMSGDGFKNKFNGNKISYVPFASNPGGSFNLIIGAISWQPVKNIWLIPNIKYVFYGNPDEGDKPGEDIYGNMTLWFKF